MTESTREPLNLDAIQARRDAITPPPWRVGQSPTFGPSAITRDAEGLSTVQDLWVADVDAVSGDATFIAHAPGDMDALFAEVRRLTEERDNLAAVIEEAKALHREYLNTTNPKENPNG